MKIYVYTYPNKRIDYLKSNLSKIKNVEFVIIDKKINKQIEENSLKVFAVSDPFETIENIPFKSVTDNSYRCNVVEKYMGYDLNDYCLEEKETMSYLLWLEIIKKQGLDLIFKIEDMSIFYAYLKGKNLVDNDVFEYKIFDNYKPKLDYSKLSLGTISLFTKFCKEYNYSNKLNFSIKKL